MECQEIATLIDAYILQAIEEEKRKEIEQHLTTCTQCQQNMIQTQQQFTELEQQLTTNSISPKDIIKKTRRQSLVLRAITWVILTSIFLYLLVIGWNIATYRYERALISELEKAIVIYRLETGGFPKTQDLYMSLVQVTKTKRYLNAWKKRINQQQFLDRWGNPIVYTFPAKYNLDLFDLYSFGKNAIDESGKNDDICNWYKGK